MGLGEIDRCSDWLEKAIDMRDPWILQIDVEPSYDPLRSHPRRQAILHRMNLQQ